MQVSAYLVTGENCCNFIALNDEGLLTINEIISEDKDNE